MANRLDNFELAIKPKVKRLMTDRMDQNQEIVTAYLNDAAFQAAAFRGFREAYPRRSLQRGCGELRALAMMFRPHQQKKESPSLAL